MLLVASALYSQDITGPFAGLSTGYSWNEESAAGGFIGLHSGWLSYGDLVYGQSYVEALYDAGPGAGRLSIGLGGGYAFVGLDLGYSVRVNHEVIHGLFTRVNLTLHVIGAFFGYAWFQDETATDFGLLLRL